MVQASAKFTVSVYNNSAVQTAGMLGGTSAVAGGTQGSFGYYPPVSTDAVTGAGGLPTTASPVHGLGHMTNIQVPATIFPSSNFTIVTVFTYAGADVAAYSTRITFPGLGIMNNMSQSASVTGGGAATVQNTMATPGVLPYGQIPGTVELIRNGGVLTVDDVQPVTINSPGGVGLGGAPGGPPPPSNVPPPQGIPPGAVPPPVAPPSNGPPIVIPAPPGSPPGTPPVTVPAPPAGSPPPVVLPPPPGSPPGTPPIVVPTPPVPPGSVTPPVAVPPGMTPPVIPPTVPTPTTPLPVVINVTRSANGGYVTLVTTGTGFSPGEQVTISIGLNNRDRRYDWRYSHKRHSAREVATAQGQVMHTFTANSRSTSSISGHLHMRGMSSGKSGQKQFSL